MPTVNLHGAWKIRADDKKGQPPPPCPQCTHCGSVTPDFFLDAIRKGYEIELADMKYGFPHKFYIVVPNANPDEVREDGGSYVDGKLTPHYGTYKNSHVKFYTEHLTDWEPLRDEAVRKEIEAATGVYFEQDAGGVKYRRSC